MKAITSVTRTSIEFFSFLFKTLAAVHDDSCRKTWPDDFDYYHKPMVGYIRISTKLLILLNLRRNWQSYLYRSCCLLCCSLSALAKHIRLSPAGILKREKKTAQVAYKVRDRGSVCFHSSRVFYRRHFFFVLFCKQVASLHRLCRAFNNSRPRKAREHRKSRTTREMILCLGVRGVRLSLEERTTEYFLFHGAFTFCIRSTGNHGNNKRQLEGSNDEHFSLSV